VKHKKAVIMAVLLALAASTWLSSPHHGAQPSLHVLGETNRADGQRAVFLELSNPCPVDLFFTGATAGTQQVVRIGRRDINHLWLAFPTNEMMISSAQEEGGWSRLGRRQSARMEITDVPVGIRQFSASYRQSKEHIFVIQFLERLYYRWLGRGRNPEPRMGDRCVMHCVERSP